MNGKTSPVGVTKSAPVETVFRRLGDELCARTEKLYGEDGRIIPEVATELGGLIRQARRFARNRLGVDLTDD